MFGKTILAVLLVGATSAVACSPKLDLEITFEHPSPHVQFTYTLDEIQSMAALGGRPLHHDAFGFYVSTVAYDIEVRPREILRAGCEVTVAKVRLILADRVIEIAKDLEFHGCRRDDIVSHYMLHAHSDDEVLRRYADQIRRVLKCKRPASPALFLPVRMPTLPSVRCA